jgi:hypothetical protein
VFVNIHTHGGRSSFEQSVYCYKDLLVQTDVLLA